VAPPRRHRSPPSPDKGTGHHEGLDTPSLRQETCSWRCRQRHPWRTALPLETPASDTRLAAQCEDVAAGSLRWPPPGGSCCPPTAKGSNEGPGLTATLTATVPDTAVRRRTQRDGVPARTDSPGRSGTVRTCGAEGVVRREWDSNPRWAGPTHAFQACRFGRSRIPPRMAPGAPHAIVSHARDRRWRPGPVQLQPVNRVRAGRQQLSAEPVVCRRPPGRHLR
jgi:hypothetical protein